MRSSKPGVPAGGHHDWGMVSQVGRVAAVMDVVSTRGPVALSEVARRTGIPKATVHRMLGLLSVHGMVVKSELGFVLGNRTRGWADRLSWPSYVEVRQRAMPSLVELYGRVGAAAGLGVWVQCAVTYPDRLFDARQLREIAPLVMRAAPHATACGKVLLAFDPQAAERFAAIATLPAFTAATITSPGLLAQELDRTRADGQGVSRGEFLPGVTALASPVWDGCRRVIAAVGVAGPAERVRGVGVSRAVRAAATEISRAIRGLSVASAA